MTISINDLEILDECRPEGSEYGTRVFKVKYRSSITSKAFIAVDTGNDRVNIYNPEALKALYEEQTTVLARTELALAAAEIFETQAQVEATRKLTDEWMKTLIYVSNKRVKGDDEYFSDSVRLEKLAEDLAAKGYTPTKQE